MSYVFLWQNVKAQEKVLIYWPFFIFKCRWKAKKELWIEISQITFKNHKLQYIKNFHFQTSFRDGVGGGGRLWCIWIMLFQFLKWNSLPKLKAALSPTSGVDQAEKLTAEWVSVGGGGGGRRGTKYSTGNWNPETLQTWLYPRLISKLTSKFQRRTGLPAYGDWKAGTTTRH